ncbi:MAG: hypothetical protein QM495_08870 [Lutibacter sp.]|uniref:hypothetical protein n=1 Tax=Lutibacter sp. TaxID=1925666 RepID=UPI0038585ABD
MKNLIFMLLALILIVSCSSDDNNNENNYYNLDTDVIFTVKDSNGNDMLNPNNQNAYLSDNIKIYYVKADGGSEEIYYPNLSSPRNFRIITPEDSQENIYAFQLFPNTYVMEDAITYIEWNNTETDTIKTNYRYGKNYTICDKIWYNNVNVWTENTEVNTGRIFEIIKN